MAKKESINDNHIDKNRTEKRFQENERYASRNMNGHCFAHAQLPEISGNCSTSHFLGRKNKTNETWKGAMTSIVRASNEDCE